MDLNKAPIPAMKMFKQDMTDPYVTGTLGQSLLFKTREVINMINCWELYETSLILLCTYEWLNFEVS